MSNMQENFPLTTKAILNFYGLDIYPIFDENMGGILHGTMIYSADCCYVGPIYITPLNKFTDKFGAAQIYCTAYYPTSHPNISYKIDGIFTIVPIFAPKN